MNFHVKCLSRILLKAVISIQPRWQIQSPPPRPLPFHLCNISHSSALVHSLFILLPRFVPCLPQHPSFFYSPLGSRFSIPLQLLLLPLPHHPPTLPHHSDTHKTHTHTHAHNLYAGRLHRLISPHCDTFGAAACGLLIISTADSRHASLSPTIPPPPACTYTHIHTYSIYIYTALRATSNQRSTTQRPWPRRTPCNHWIWLRSG